MQKNNNNNSALMNGFLVEGILAIHSKYIKTGVLDNSY